MTSNNTSSGYMARPPQKERDLAALELDAWEMLMVALAAAEAGRACCNDIPDSMRLGMTAFLR